MCGVVGKCVIMRALSPHHNVSLTNKGRKKLRRRTIRGKTRGEKNIKTARKEKEKKDRKKERGK